MVSPTTLSFSIFALVLGDRPLRTGVLFYAGALGATLGVGVAAAFVLGDIAASSPSTPKHWVGWVDVALGSLALVYVFRALRRPRDPRKEEAMMTRMSKVASSPAVAVVGAGAALGEPRRIHPDRAQDDLAERSDPGGVHRAVGRVLGRLASTARGRDRAAARRA